MMLIKFYYFAFLHYYKQKGEDWVPWHRSIMVVEMTIFFLVALIYSVLQHFFFSVLPIVSLRIYGFGFCVLLFLVLYRGLVRGGKSEKIYNEFISHPWNTKKNRVACFIIFFVSLLLMMGCVVALKGYINFR